MSEIPNGLRGEMAAACFDPGAYVGPRGARTTDQWRADACIVGPLATILAQVSALQAEVERLQKERDEAREVVALCNNSFGSYSYHTSPHPAEQIEKVKEQARSEWRRAEEALERLQKVEGEREKDEGAPPAGSGCRPNGSSPRAVSPPNGASIPRAWPPLADVAEHIPPGFECRSCGSSAYNWLKKCTRYEATGEGCCPDFRKWIRKAQAGEPTIEQKREVRQAANVPFIGLPLGNGEWV